MAESTADVSDIEAQIQANIEKSLSEIPHPSQAAGTSLYGSTKIFPDYRAEDGESYLTLIHGIPHESSVSFVAILQATRALRKGFESAIYFYGPGTLACMATRGFPTTGDSGFPGEQNMNGSIETFIKEGGTVLLLPLRHGAARPARGGPHRGRHPVAPARRPGRPHPLRPQGRHHQLHLQPVT